MRLGLRHLHLHPRDFWALTPAELMLILGLDQGPQMMTAQGLAMLMARFPDQQKETKDE